MPASPTTVTAARERWGPLVRRPEREPRGSWLQGPAELSWPDVAVPPAVTIWIPRGLLAVTVVLTLITSWVPRGALPWILGIAAATAVWQELWMRWPLERLGLRVLIAAVQWALSAALVLLDPLAAFFAWTGYLVAGTLFTGALLVVFTTLTAASVALGQIGGLPQLPSSVVVYLLVFALNAAVALGFTVTVARREEAVRRRDAATRELLAARRRNDELQQQLVGQARLAGRSEERARLAREIHDTVAQGLVAVITQLEAIPDGGVPDAARGRVERATALARQALGDARRAVDALTPAPLDDGDLPAALRRLVDDRAAGGALATEVRVSGAVRPTDHDAVLVRVTQEALANAARHASAARVVLTLTYFDDEVLLDIADDGRGFVPDAVGGPTEDGGHGLPGMRQRVALAGGRLTVESEPGAGTVVSAAVPG